MITTSCMVLSFMFILPKFHYVSEIITVIIFKMFFPCMYILTWIILQPQYAAISIKVVPKTREKVEYERERLIGKD